MTRERCWSLTCLEHTHVSNRCKVETQKSAPRVTTLVRSHLLWFANFLVFVLLLRGLKVNRHLRNSPSPWVCCTGRHCHLVTDSSPAFSCTHIFYSNFPWHYVLEQNMLLHHHFIYFYYSYFRMIKYDYGTNQGKLCKMCQIFVIWQKQTRLFSAICDFLIKNFIWCIFDSEEQKCGLWQNDSTCGFG